MFDKLVDPEVRNTLVTDMLDFINPDDDNDTDSLVPPQTFRTKIPGNIQSALGVYLKAPSPKYAIFLPHLTVNGITYSGSTKHLGNSGVMIRTCVTDTPIPARIEYIIQFEFCGQIQTHLVIRRFMSANIIHNPFKRYPSLQASMWDTNLDQLEIISEHNIQSHYAYCPTRWENKRVNVVMSLSRV
jgi:hypothetical protein